MKYWHKFVEILIFFWNIDINLLKYWHFLDILTYIYRNIDFFWNLDINLSIYRYIYIYIERERERDGPRGVIWNLVVRASFFNVFFTINSKYHVFDLFFSASILTFSCGSNGMGPNILFSAICEVRGGFDFPKGVFSRNKRICS